MGQPIVISMSDILLLAGSIVTISAAVKVICEAIDQMRKPNKDEELKVLKSETWVAPVTEPVLEEPTI